MPKDMAAAKKLAEKGHKLLERYHAKQDVVSRKGAKKKANAKAVAVKVPKHKTREKGARTA